MTRRMVLAVASPHVDILGHCTGRKLVGRGRPPSAFDAEIVFAACAQFDTALEINCRPERQDPPDELVDLALEWGLRFAIDTDAHAPGQMEWQAYGCDKAARHGIEPDQHRQHDGGRRPGRLGRVARRLTADAIHALTPLPAYADAMDDGPQPRNHATDTATQHGSAPAVDPTSPACRPRSRGAVPPRRRPAARRATRRDALGDPDALAARMLATVPEPSPWAELGPFYSTTGIARVLGGVSAARPSRSGAGAAPSWPCAPPTAYGSTRRSSSTSATGWRRGMADVLDRFRPQTPATTSGWSPRSWPPPSPAWAVRTIVDHLRAGRRPGPVLDLADERAARWALAT